MNTTLFSIRQKIRRITATPSGLQLSDAEIDNYINTFYLYDLPEELKLFTLKTNYSFTTVPNIAKYDFPVERYISVEQPVYVAGYQVVYHEDQQEFYSIWPKLNFFQDVGIGDGISTSPVLSNLQNVSVLRGFVTLSTTIGGNTSSFLDNEEGSFLNIGEEISSVSTANPAVITTSLNHNLVTGDSVFISGVNGTNAVNGGPFIVTVLTPTTFSVPIDTTATVYTGGGIVQREAGTIDYITGALTMDWGSPPDSGVDIEAQTVSYRAARPTDILFFENQFIFRPVPDRAYRVEVEVFRFPTQLIASTQSPELRQWWQYLAWGASMKIFEDRGDLEQINKFYPLFDYQKRLVQRRTLMQLRNRRVATPYSDEAIFPYGDFYPLF